MIYHDSAVKQNVRGMYINQLTVIRCNPFSPHHKLRSTLLTHRHIKLLQSRGTSLDRNKSALKHIHHNELSCNCLSLFRTVCLEAVDLARCCPRSLLQVSIGVKVMGGSCKLFPLLPSLMTFRKDNKLSRSTRNKTISHSFTPLLDILLFKWALIYSAIEFYQLKLRSGTVIHFDNILNLKHQKVFMYLLFVWFWKLGPCPRRRILTCMRTEETERHCWTLRRKTCLTLIR